MSFTDIPLAEGELPLEPLIRALEHYLHSEVIDAFPGDDVALATLLATLKEIPPCRPDA